MVPQLAAVPREQRRAMLRRLAKDNEAFPESLVKIPLAAWPTRSEDEQRVGLWRSREFIVQAFEERAGVLRLSVNRTEVDARTLDWRADISWDDLQRLKTEAGFGHLEAVEIYPPAGREVNVANLRHLWVLPERLPFSW